MRLPNDYATCNSNIPNVQIIKALYSRQFSSTGYRKMAPLLSGPLTQLRYVIQHLDKVNKKKCFCIIGLVSMLNEGAATKFCNWSIE